MGSADGGSVRTPSFSSGLFGPMIWTLTWKRVPAASVSTPVPAAMQADPSRSDQFRVANTYQRPQVAAITGGRRHIPQFKGLMPSIQHPNVGGSVPFLGNPSRSNLFAVIAVVA
jgi:hypothetical protein